MNDINAKEFKIFINSSYSFYCMLAYSQIILMKKTNSGKENSTLLIEFQAFECDEVGYNDE